MNDKTFNRQMACENLEKLLREFTALSRVVMSLTPVVIRHATNGEAAQIVKDLIVLEANLMEISK